MQVKTPASAAVLYMLIWVKTIASAPDIFFGGFPLPHKHTLQPENTCIGSSIIFVDLGENYCIDTRYFLSPVFPLPHKPTLQPENTCIGSKFRAPRTLAKSCVFHFLQLVYAI
jgi:hypothetical protein